MIDTIKDIALKNNIIFKRHALSRMLERGVAIDSILEILIKPVIVEEYGEDRPYPSMLLLGFSHNRPLHVVLSIDQENEILYIITTYEPTPEFWETGFTVRRK